jgi:two-component system sensor histidine kinase DesK
MRLYPLNPELGWTPFAWLIYLGFFLMYPGLGRASALEWTATFSGVAVFLVLYFWGYWFRDGDPRVAWTAAGMVVLGTVFAPSNPGSSIFFVYPSAFLARLRPVRRAVYALLLLQLTIALVAWALGLSVSFWAPAMVFALVTGGINLHFAEVGRANTRLRVTQEEVERLAQTAERERIARDLHDLLGHTLSLITLKSELAAKLLARDPARAEVEIREVERISRQALKEVRSAIAGYRSEGLVAEMARARLALESAGVKLEYFAVPLELAPVEETVLSLALREAVTNVIRHARAHTCRITLEQSEEETRLEVRDDGQGAAAPEGMGLTAMRERIEGLGGRLEHRLEGGTVLAMALPRRREAERRTGEVPAAPPRLTSERA